MYLIPIPIPLRTDTPRPPKRRQLSSLKTYSPSFSVDDEESDANENSSTCHRSRCNSVQLPQPVWTFRTRLNRGSALQPSFQLKSDDSPEKIFYWSQQICLFCCACSETLRFQKLSFGDTENISPWDTKKPRGECIDPTLLITLLDTWIFFFIAHAHIRVGSQ